MALKGGWTAGKFTDKGVVPDLKTCIEHCCDQDDCDLVMLLSQKCFTIHCYSLDDCQTTPNGHAHIAYVSRDGYQISKCELIYDSVAQLLNYYLVNLAWRKRGQVKRKRAKF